MNAALVSEETYHVDGVRGVRLSRSGKALLCAGGVCGEGTWIPLGQLRSGSQVRHEGDRGLLVVGAWLAEKKGWL